ncbi:MAG: hypothetical protein FWF77_10065 [Defluviitaleaceae bacterium]|nr:hypothetical protein [Defluviitaleaceae bacterium]
MSDNFWGNVGHVPTQSMNWVAPREPSQDLDRQAFLNLLITQLRYQDPLNPMDDRDFIAQMAQFSALEQMMNLNATFERTQAFGMIGKLVDADFPCPVTGDRIEIEGGLVTSVKRSGQSVFLVVAGEGGRPVDVPFDAVTEVSEDFLLPQLVHEIFTNLNAQRGTDLIGTYVMGFARFGNDREFIEGRVDSVSMQDGMVVLVVGNRQIFFPHDVFSAHRPRPGENGVENGMRLIGSEHFRDASGNSLQVAGVDVETNSDGSHHVFLRWEDGTPRTRVNLINHVIDALTYVGHSVTFGSANNAEVRAITIRGGIPFLVAYNHGVAEPVEVDFLAYLAHRHNVENPGGEDDD